MITFAFVVGRYNNIIITCRPPHNFSLFLIFFYSKFTISHEWGKLYLCSHYSHVLVAVTVTYRYLLVTWRAQTFNGDNIITIFHWTFAHSVLVINVQIGTWPQPSSVFPFLFPTQTLYCIISLYYYNIIWRLSLRDRYFYLNNCI